MSKLHAFNGKNNGTCKIFGPHITYHLKNLVPRKNLAGKLGFKVCIYGTVQSYKKGQSSNKAVKNQVVQDYESDPVVDVDNVLKFSSVY